MSIATISPADCRRRMETDASALLIDVRMPPEFIAVHATGARSIPLGDLKPADVKAMRACDKDPIFVICQAGGRSARACEQLAAAGLANVHSVDGGTSAWEKAGLPVVRGVSTVISLERQVRIFAGAMVFVGTLLAAMVHPAFLIVPGFIGAGLVFAGVTNFCGMGLLLAKMPWNQGAGCAR